MRDMWLTGFDAPCLHTMYVDKPMRGHGLMQAIARVNRVFRDKPGGLVVDYLGLAEQLKRALATYTESGGHGQPSIDTAEAIAVMQEKYEMCCNLHARLRLVAVDRGGPGLGTARAVAARAGTYSGAGRRQGALEPCRHRTSRRRLLCAPPRTRRRGSATTLPSSRPCARPWPSRPASGRPTKNWTPPCANWSPRPSRPPTR